MPEASLTWGQRKVLQRVHERLSAYPETHSQGFWYCGPHRTGGSRGLVRAAHGCARPEDNISVDAAEMAEREITACLSGQAVLAAMELGIKMPQMRDQQRLAALLIGLPRDSYLFANGPSTEEVHRLVGLAVADGHWPESALAPDA